MTEQQQYHECIKAEANSWHRLCDTCGGPQQSREHSQQPTGQAIGKGKTMDGLKAGGGLQGRSKPPTAPVAS